MTTFRVLHLFSGLGGGALGFQRAHAAWKGSLGRFETVCGVDNDPESCADFTALTGAPAEVANIATMSAEELRAVAGERAPDVVFMSPPCKGFSGLLPAARAASEKYQALNRLVLQGLWLVLKTWPRPPRLILVENVPRITSRGADLLLQVKQLLGAVGYRFAEGYHDCGELGGLAQHRRRYLLIARHEEQFPTFVYEPRRRRVRAIGEVLEQLPMPDDSAGGRLHRLPRLQWKTWVRLALIPAGGDWRDLPEGEYEVSGDPERFKGRPGLMRVAPWGEPITAVTGSASPTGSNGTSAVADPRLRRPFNNVWRVARWSEPAEAVTAGSGPSSSGVCVADPRLAHEPRRGTFRIVPWDGSAPTVVGVAGVGRSSAFAVADPRFSSQMQVNSRGQPLGTVTGAKGPWQGAPSVADPRLGCAPRAGAYRVLPWDQPAPAVIGSADVHAGAAAVADPRLPGQTEPPIIISEDGTWHRPLTTLELAALQGLPTTMPDGSPLELAGRSDARWRERVGNAVPPPAAQAIAEALLDSLLPASAGQGWVMGSGSIWVRPQLQERSA